MRHFKILYLILLEVFVVGVALSMDIKTYKLPNGANLIFAPRDDTQAVAIHVWFGVGSIYENYTQKGMAHFLEHMLFNGTEKYQYGQIDFIVESLGGQINAGTSKEYTFYHIEIAKPYWKQALDILYQITQKPLLLPEMIEKEKPIVIEEIKRGKDSPRNNLWESFESLSYKVSNYRYPIIGYEETVRNFTRESLMEFFKNYYQPRNMHIVVVGDLDFEELKEEVLKTFGKEESRPVAKPDTLPEPKQLESRAKTIQDPRVDRAHWIIGWWCPPIGSKEYYALLVLDQIIGSGRTSVFYRELKEKGLVYSVSTGDFGRPRDNLWVINATFEPSKYEQVKERVFELLKNLSDSLTDEDINKAKERIINSTIFTTESVNSQAYYIGYSVTVVGLLDYYRFFENNIKSVRKEDVLRVLDNYLLGKAYNEVLMVPQR